MQIRGERSRPRVDELGTFLRAQAERLSEFRGVAQVAPCPRTFTGTCTVTCPGRRRPPLGRGGDEDTVLEFEPEETLDLQHGASLGANCPTAAHADRKSSSALQEAASGGRTVNRHHDAARRRNLMRIGIPESADP